MSAPRDPDVILAEWLDDGPVDLPSTTRRAISTAVRTTPQARTGFGPLAWRPTMSKFLVLAGAAAAVAIAARIERVAWWSRDLTVPTGTPTTWAIVATGSPA